MIFPSAMKALDASEMRESHQLATRKEGRAIDGHGRSIGYANLQRDFKGRFADHGMNRGMISTNEGRIV